MSKDMRGQDLTENNDEQMNAIEELIQKRKDLCHQKWRELTGDSLIDAKSIVEHFEQHGVWISVDDLPQFLKPSLSIISTCPCQNNPLLSALKIHVQP